LQELPSKTINEGKIETEDKEEDVSSYLMTLRKWYQKLKEEALGCTLWRNCSGRDYRQVME
jgi:hypothetical protein